MLVFYLHSGHVSTTVDSIMELFEDTSLIQGSPAWKAARRRRIGGTAISAIMGVNKYKTRLELFEQMTGQRDEPDIGHLPHVRRGVDAEPVARRLVEKWLDVKYTTPVVVDPEFDYMVASLDGLTDDHTLEIKTGSMQAHQDARIGVIPYMYRLQCQWGMMVSGMDRCLYVSYRPEDESIHHVWIERNDVMIADMRQAAIEFWAMVESGEWVEGYTYVD